MIDARDRVYLRRTYELAARGRGGTSPNPCVGAMLVRELTTLAEGFHRARGGPHAEVDALTEARTAGTDVRGATAYVSLEPCDHEGLTPPCTRALVDAEVSRVVIGARDPNPRTAGAGVARLQASGIDVDVADESEAKALVEDFAVSVKGARPFVHLKMAASLDGYVAPRIGPYWLTGECARDYVRELRTRYDAVLVGAGTVRIDDPRLTVRPPHARRRPYVRIVACEGSAVRAESRIFERLEGYAPTIVLAPAGSRASFAALEAIGDVLYVGAPDSTRLDLGAALAALRTRDITSVLCEGGPTLAARLLERKLVDRVDWLIAPRFLANEHAVPALDQADVAGALGQLRFEQVERLGEDLRVSLRVGAE